MTLLPYDPSSLCSHFDWVPPVARLYGKHRTCQVGRRAQVIASQRLPSENLFGWAEVSRNDTRPWDTCVFTTRGQLAIFLAMKLLEELESSSTEIDQPLYWRRNSATERPRWPRTIVPTR